MNHFLSHYMLIPFHIMLRPLVINLNVCKCLPKCTLLRSMGLQRYTLPHPVDPAKNNLYKQLFKITPNSNPRAFDK